MKHFYASICILAITFASFNLNAQTAADFTLTDTEGNSHTLYDYLDNGDYVILDFFATWCGPCIGSLPGIDEIWYKHGPNGDQTLTVLSLEADATTDNELEFISSFNVPNPMFDNGHTVSGSFGVSAFPTFILVCPDRSYTEVVGGIGTNASLLLDPLAMNCGAFAPTVVNDAQIMHADMPKWFCSGEAINPMVSVMNSGSAMMTSLTLKVLIDGAEANSISWTGSVPQYGEAAISIPFTGLTDADHVITFEISELNGATSADENTQNNTHDYDLKFAENIFGETALTLDLTPDSYGSEVTWELLENGTVAYSGGPYTDGNTTPISETLNLNAESCYEFHVKDSYGDGLNGSDPAGTFSLKKSDGTDLIALMSGELFSDQSMKMSTSNPNPSLGIEGNSLVELLSISPNPVSTSANISFTLTESQDVTVKVYDAMGKVMQNVITVNQIGAHAQTIDVSNFASGIYIVELSSDNFTQTERISVVK